MILLNKLKSLALLLLVFGFLFATTLNSCGGKKENDTTEQSEHPNGEEEHPTDSIEDEHPTEGEEEHPDNG